MRAKVIITGGSGLLGSALRQAFADCRVLAPTSRMLDITDASSVERTIAREQPDLILHSAAMTEVDACALEPERAQRVNAEGTRHLADAAARHRVRLIALSTDYVFAGDAGRPYAEEDGPAPGNVYGASKLAAEHCAAHCPDHVIARVSWLFGPGRVCFVDQLVDWGSRDDDDEPVRVAADQWSIPTFTRSAARALRAVAESSFRGVVHIASPTGCSRYELARAVFDLLDLHRPLVPCAMAELAAPAHRPRDTRLACGRLAELGIRPLPDWRDDLAAYLRAAYRH